MTARTLLLVGTKKGAFILESDETRRDWAMRGPLCEGWPVHDLIVEPGSGALLAAAGSPWFGGAVWRSDDLGATWTHSSAGITYGDDGPGDQDDLEPRDDPGRRAARRRRAGRAVPEHRRRRDLVARRGPPEPPDAGRPGSPGPAA